MVCSIHSCVPEVRGCDRPRNLRELRLRWLSGVDVRQIMGRNKAFLPRTLWPPSDAPRVVVSAPIITFSIMGMFCA